MLVLCCFYFSDALQNLNALDIRLVETDTFSVCRYQTDRGLSFSSIIVSIVVSGFKYFYVSYAHSLILISSMSLSYKR